MTNYVIDPQVFHWINVMETLQFGFELLGVVFVLAFLGLVIGWIYNSCEVERGYKSNLFYLKVCKRWAIVTGIIGFVLVTAATFIPGRITSIEMLIAKIATFDNANWTVQQLKEGS